MCFIYLFLPVLGKLDLGVFVKDIIPGGPAERNGKVRAGDRIIAINGQSLEGLPHQRAVELIRDSHNQVRYDCVIICDMTELN